MARKTPGLNTSSMADISFLLLAFFLMVSDIKTDKGLARVLPPPKKEEKKTEQIQILDQNLFVVLINGENNIYTRKGTAAFERCPINELKGRVKEFLLSGDRPETLDLPELEVAKDTAITKYLGAYKVSKGIISLQCHNSTSYNVYFQVQNELTAAINELRNELSSKKFGRTNYMDLPSDKANNQRKAVEKAIPMAISEAKPSNLGGTN